MTRLAFQRLMFPGQRIFGRHVIEMCQRLPAVDGVTLFAVGPQLLLMAILMTAQAISVQSFECPVQVPNLYKFAVRRSYILRIVALLTVQPGVAAQQWITSLTVIKFLFGGFPFVDPHCPAVVLRMTPNTIRVSLFSDAPVVTLPLTHQLPDLSMTLQALEFERASTEYVATATICRGIQGFMRLG